MENSAIGFSEGSEPIKLTDEQERIEKEALAFASREFIADRTDKLIAGYIAGATAEHKLLKPQLEYADNYIRMITDYHDKLVEHLKEERNKAIQWCINSVNNISDKETLLKKLESLKSDSK